MIKVEHLDTWGFEHAIRGMRNPKNSWDLSDTEFNSYILTVDQTGQEELHLSGIPKEIGQNDLKLMKNLFNAGSEHRKYLRQIMISMDITAPFYWWKEFDTYKIGTVADSCSTMHKIHSKEFVLDDFSYEHLTDHGVEVLLKTIDALNMYRNLFLNTKDKKYWWNMIQLLPTSYNQKRTVTMNYEVAYRIIEQRSHHKLDEWHNFVAVLLEKVPFLSEIVTK